MSERSIYLRDQAEKSAPPVPLPVPGGPPDVLHFHRTIDSLEKENAWLKAQLARIIRDK
jgi:hypothetical protein